MRITIKLYITIGQHTLVDQFKWEINNPLNSPESFAEQMARDLSLAGEFTTAIAHSIRERSQLFIRGLFVTGHDSFTLIGPLSNNTITKGERSYNGIYFGGEKLRIGPRETHQQRQ